MIHYHITPANPQAHLFHVKIDIKNPIQPIQKLRLPNWIPGSYLIRDFSKNIIDLQAKSQQDEHISLQQVDKSNWQFSCDQPVTIEYQVYAWDLSVRSAHFDETHAFYNGTSTFLEVVDQANSPCTVSILETEFTKNQKWQVATGMPESKVNALGFGQYEAENYTALIDYPVEIGTFKTLSFEANGIPHKMVITGVFDLDEKRFTEDLIKICETELNLFGGNPPIKSYVFMLMVTGSDYGGLEHSNSTALICSRNDLPYKGMQKATDGYLQLLELCSHEYFHTWNVKRIQPAVYQNSNLQQPEYTNQLWWFEGITSYYDALILLRADLIDQATYLKTLAKQMTRVYRMPGRFQQSVAESSWNTWTKFYQQDENAPNAIISYYSKGSLIALALDLKIRAETNNQKSLDDVLLHLWEKYGRTRQGILDGEIEKACSEVSGIELTEFFSDYLFDRKDIPFKELFKPFGIEFNLQAPTALDDLGGNLNNSNEPLPTFLGANLQVNETGLKLTHLWNNQPASLAGLASGDTIIAINNLKVTSKAQLETMLKRSQAGQEWLCHYFRRDELRQTQITLQSPPEDRVVLQQINNDTAEQSYIKTPIWLD